jgi:MFS family permease
MSAGPGRRRSPGRPGSLAALRSRPLRLLAGGQLVSNVGDGLYAVALPWYVLSHHGGAILLAVVLAAYGIPRTCLIMVGGHLSDRLGPWNVMMGADIGRLALAGALAVLAATRRPELITLAPVAFGLGAGEGLFLPASYAIMPRLVPDEELPGANALLSASTQIAAFAGPAAGGIVVAAVSAAAGFGLDALSFGVSALTLWRLGATAVARATADRGAGRPATGAGDSPSSDSPSGDSRRPPDPAAPARPATVTKAAAPAEPAAQGVWAFVRSEPLIPLLVAINIAGNLCSAGTSEVALPLFARGHLHAGAGGYGILVAGFGVGALAGAMLAARLRHGRRLGVTSGVLFLVQAPLIAFLAWAPGLAAAAAILVAWGMLNMWANVITQTAFQRWAPPALIGRLSGILLTTSYGMFPVSVALAGFVVHRFGPGAFFLLSAVTIAATLAWALSRPVFRDFGARPGPRAVPAPRAAPHRSREPLRRTA